MSKRSRIVRRRMRAHESRMPSEFMKRWRMLWFLMNRAASIPFEGHVYEPDADTPAPEYTEPAQ